MRAWFMVAASRPHQKFYAYTKSLGMWLNLKDIIPPNFYLTASQGGTLDYLIPKYPEVFQRIAHVVYTEEEAQERGLSVDHDAIALVTSRLHSWCMAPRGLGLMP
jgi:hypothetical protein